MLNLIPRTKTSRELIEDDLRAGGDCHDIAKAHGVKPRRVRDIELMMEKKGEPTLSQRRKQKHREGMNNDGRID